MRVLTIALCLLATPALADVAGVASVIDGDTLEIHGRIRIDGSFLKYGVTRGGFHHAPEYPNRREIRKVAGDGVQGLAVLARTRAQGLG